MPEAPSAPADARTDEEGALLARVRSGDLSAFEVLYRAHAGRVYALCLRLTGDPGRAEDLTQEAFLRAWRKLGSFEGRSAFSSWLHRLTVNVVLDAQRAEARRRRMEDPLEQTDGELDGARGAPAADDGARIDLEAAIRRLPPGARIVYVLHDIEGYRHEEIAEQAGIAVGTSKAQLHRARALLRKTLSR